MFLFILKKDGIKQLESHLNTSHVLIYHLSNFEAGRTYTNLNTSHVLIYLVKNRRKKQCKKDLNTSHVLIYLIMILHYYPPYSFYFQTNNIAFYNGNNSSSMFHLPSYITRPPI